MQTQGEVSEWFKVQTWNVCVGATPPRVRIPPSPILKPPLQKRWFFIFSLILSVVVFIRTKQTHLTINISTC